MKTRLVIIVLLLLALTVLQTRHDERIYNALLSVINPIKQGYQSFTQELEDKSHSYIFQKESIEKLNKTNRILQKRLFEQSHYLQQVRNIYAMLPQLNTLPVHTISITETISYVKLNSFSQIILTRPVNLEEKKLYGLIQGDVVAGIAEIKHGQLMGYLTSDRKCKFTVFVGDALAPGVAVGITENEMMVKFIPKWYDLKPGDKVVTSGLDSIFFGNLPVGEVTRVEALSSYKVAHIQTYSDIYHPKTFFLINDASPTLVEGFDSNRTNLTGKYTIPPEKVKESDTVRENRELSSTINQTLETTVEIKEIEEKEEPKNSQSTPQKPLIQEVLEEASFDLF